jgi:hypothetical protein
MPRSVAVSLVVCALSGCDYFWHIDHVDLDVDASTSIGDGAGGDAEPVPLCTYDPAIDDDFVAPQVCPWGSSFNNTKLSSGTGYLRVALTSSGSSAGCDANNFAFADGGVAVSVTEILQGNNAYTSLQLYASGYQETLTINGNRLYYEDPSSANRWGQVQFANLDQVRWLRLRPDRVGDTTIPEYSADGETWLQIPTAHKGSPPPTISKISIVAGVNAAGSIIGETHFDRFVVCKP